MSVVIRGMEMPNNCGACPLRLAWCRERIYMVNRPERCPLIPVPPHGWLIDADALKDTLDYYIREAGWSDEINEALTWVRDEFIDHEPTVIEAEGVSE